MSIPNPNMINDMLSGPGVGGYQPVATDSARGLFRDSAGNYMSQMGGGLLSHGSPDRLEFPSTLGTEKHSHLNVFHIYTGFEAGFGDMTQEDMINATDGLKSLGGGQVWGGVGGGAAGLAAGSRLAKGIPSRWRFLLPILGLAGGGYGGMQAGEAIAFENLPDVQQTALTKLEANKKLLTEQWAQANAQSIENTGRTLRFGEALNKSKQTIALYMPQKIQALSLLDYEQQDMSFMQNLMNTWTGLAARTVLTKAPGGGDNVAGFLGMNTNIDSYLLAGARIAPNPRKQLLFREPISRKFEFNFNFSPRNEEESVRAYEIIKRFKKNAYPTLNQKYGSGAFYNFPAEFEIEYQTVNQFGDIVENDWINRIGRCALREINVDYASSGSFSTFESTGAPTNMVMSLTFEEMALLDANHIEDGY